MRWSGTAGVAAALLCLRPAEASSDPNYPYGYRSAPAHGGDQGVPHPDQFNAGDGYPEQAPPPPQQQQQPPPQGYDNGEYNPAYTGETTPRPSFGNPPSVDRSGMRRTVAQPYSTGQHLQYRGKTVHQQQDYRAAGQGAMMEGVQVNPNVVRLLGHVKGPAVATIFALFAWHMYARYESILGGSAVLLKPVVVPIFALLVAANVTGAGIGLLSIKGAKRRLKMLLNINAAVEFAAIVSNLFLLLVNPVTKWRTRADIADAIIYNFFMLIFWFSVTKMSWFPTAG